MRVQGQITVMRAQGQITVMRTQGQNTVMRVQGQNTVMRVQGQNTVMRVQGQITMTIHIGMGHTSLSKKFTNNLALREDSFNVLRQARIRFKRIHLRISISTNLDIESHYSLSA